MVALAYGFLAKYVLVSVSVFDSEKTLMTVYDATNRSHPSCLFVAAAAAAAAADTLPSVHGALVKFIDFTLV